MCTCRTTKLSEESHHPISKECIAVSINICLSGPRAQVRGRPLMIWGGPEEIEKNYFSTLGGCGMCPVSRVIENQTQHMKPQHYYYNSMKTATHSLSISFKKERKKFACAEHLKPFLIGIPIAF